MGCINSNTICFLKTLCKSSCVSLFNKHVVWGLKDLDISNKLFMFISTYMAYSWINMTCEHELQSLLCSHFSICLNWKFSNTFIFYIYILFYVKYYIISTYNIRFIITAFISSSCISCWCCFVLFLLRVSSAAIT